MHNRLQLVFIRLYFWMTSTLLPSFAVYSAHKLFHFPINTKRKNRNALTLPSPKRFNVTFYDDLTLQCYRWGEASHPKVLLVHGWSTTAQSMTHFTHALLQKKYQVISYDALRHGESQKSFSDLASWADSVRAVMLDIGEVECIIAHSFGGAAVTVASKLGLATKKLALIAPIHDIAAVADDFAERFGIPLDIIKKMRSYTWEKNKEHFNKYGTNWNDIVHSKFKVPTLLIHDTDDKEIGVSHSKQICKMWQWAQLIETKGLGHRKILDSQKVVDDVLHFIQAKQEV